jgi:hypothetical protein
VQITPTLPRRFVFKLRKGTVSDCFSPDQSPILCAQCEQERKARQVSPPPPIAPPLNPFPGRDFLVSPLPAELDILLSAGCFFALGLYPRVGSIVMEITSKLFAGFGF